MEDQPAPEINLLENQPQKRYKVVLHNIKTWVKENKKLSSLAIIAIALTIVALTATFALPQTKDIVRKLSQPQDQTSQLPDGFTKMVIPEREPPYFVLASATDSRWGILPSDKFTLTAKEPIEASLIENLLTASVPVQVAAVSENQIDIIPISDLAKDQPIIISLKTKYVEHNGHTFDRDYSWAFQTQGDFRVISHIPGDKATDVPVNTGIEFTLSQDDYENYDKLIAIQPSVEFWLEKHDETIAIVPLEPLAPRTTYTVTLKKGLNLSSRNDPIQEDFTITFQTEAAKEKENAPYISLDDSFIQITPRDQAQVKVHHYNVADTPIKATLYQFSSTGQFIDSRKNYDQAYASWWHYYSETDPVDTTQLQKVFDADLAIQSQNDISFLQLPQALPQGLYLATFTYGDDRLEQLWLQSSFISGYTQVGRQQTLVWTNSLDDATTIELATVRVHGFSDEYQLDSNGAATFTSPSALFDAPSKYLIVRNLDGKEIILPVSQSHLGTGPGKKTPNDYWSYLYQERYMYQPNDTVHYWGVIKDRDSNQPPGTVTVKISNGYSNGVTVYQQQITPAADGSFIGSLNLENLNDGWYYLQLFVDDVKITQTGFQVWEYTKPELKIEVSTDKQAIFYDESATVQVKSTFFDGTPVRDMQFNITSHQGETPPTINTNPAGSAEFTYTTTYDADNYRYPRYQNIVVTPSSSQEEVLEGTASLYVFGPRLKITTDNSQDGSTARLRATINHIDLTNINAGKSNDYTGAPANGVKVNLTITKEWYERQEAGTYYDYIEKVTRPRYTFKKHSEPITQTQLTSDTSGNLAHDFEMEDQKSYQAVLSFTDEKGKPVESKSYFYYYANNSFSNNQVETTYKLTLGQDTNTFSAGDPVKLSVLKNGQPYTPTGRSSILYTTAKRGNQSYVITNTPEYNFTFESQHIPNVSVGAVIFTGTHYQDVSPSCQWEWHCYYDYYSYYDSSTFQFSGITLEYDKIDSQLDVDITPGQSPYAPGDTATIRVKVTKNNNPVPGAHVNLTLVDQALEAIGGVRKPSILSSIYQHIPADIYYRYYTHRPIFPDAPQAEKGGGGGDRELFKDTPYFGQAATDDQGIAEFTFALSDNITTWNVYAQAINGAIDAGQALTYLPVTQDFFVTNQFVKQLLVSDQPKLAANSFGRSLDANQSVNFEVEFMDANDQFIDKQTQSSNAFNEISFAFPSLSQGSYKAAVRGSTPTHQDGIVYPFGVFDTRMHLISSEEHSIEAGQSLTQLENPFLESDPVKLVVTDTGKGRYYYQLIHFSYCHSNRLEKQISRLAANQILEEQFDATGCTGDQSSITDFQNHDGGLNQVNWGGSNLESTTWAVFVDPTPFDHSGLIKYFESQLYQSSAGSLQYIQAAWGLSLLGEPQIVKLQQLKNQAATFEEKVLIALALASIGSTEEANELYLDILADFAYQRDPYIRIQAPTDDADTDAYVKNTGHALLLSSLVQSQYSQGMHDYLNHFGYQAEDIVTDLADIAFIESELGKLPPQDTRFSFTAPGISTTKDLIKGKNWSVTLNPPQAQNFTLSLETGKAEATFLFTLPPGSLNQVPQDDRLSISRTITKSGGNSAIQPGDIVTITIPFDVAADLGPKGRYTVTDHLPSGLSLIQNPGLYGLTGSDYVREVRPNVIEYTFYNSDHWQLRGDKTLVYYSRAAAPGTYTAEPAIIQSHIQRSVLKFTDPATITIGELK